MSSSRVERHLDRTTLAVCALAGLALVVRLVGLGDRPLHWDEARVGYWSLRYLETGYFSYRPIAGGPLVYILSRWSLALFGPTDFALRLPVAVFGGVLPLAALLFRGRLRDSETVAFAAILAASPLLVYYGRFARGDVFAIGFTLVALGFALRLVDGAGRENAYGLAAAVALAIGSSGLGVVALVCLGIAALLVADHAALVSSVRPIAMQLGTLSARLEDAVTPAARSVLVFAACYIFMFAPRAGETDAAGIDSPGTILTAIDVAIFESVRRFVGVRIVHRGPDGTHELLPYLADTVGLVALAALPILVLAAGTFLIDRYTAGGPREIVSIGTYWVGASVVFVPMFTEVSAPWLGVYLVVPLAIPAAVGLAALVRWGRTAIETQDVSRSALALLLAVALVAQAGAVTASDVYGSSDRDNQLAHYAQPTDDFADFRDNFSSWVTPGDGQPDVLYYGQSMYVSENSTAFPPVPEAWGERLPLDWYVAREDAESISATTPTQVRDLDSVPPVVIAPASARGELSPMLDGYAATEYQTALWGRSVVVFVEN
ncbi:flippase activity-associated protein Agl23 [Haloferax namakaokahaiae]|uniref:Flippase activity-associated protein Agl23 n=1 Tax=Haloferax namakaokahaiae TaxID=1748331 RepID=A0ABD5ZEC3_9EURY